MSVLKPFKERFPSLNPKLNPQASLNTLTSRHTHQQSPLNYNLTGIPKSLFPTCDLSNFTEEPDFLLEAGTKKFKKDGLPINMFPLENINSRPIQRDLLTDWQKPLINGAGNQMSYFNNPQQYPYLHQGLNKVDKKLPAIINLEDDEDDEEDCLIIEDKPSIDPFKELKTHTNYPQGLLNDFALQNGQLYQNNYQDTLGLLDPTYHNSGLSLLQNLAGVSRSNFLPQNEWGSLPPTAPLLQDDTSLLQLQVLKLWDLAKIPDRMMNYVQNPDENLNQNTMSSNTEFDQFKNDKAIETIFVHEQEIEPQKPRDWKEKIKPAISSSPKESKKTVQSDKWEKISIISDDSDKSFERPNTMNTKKRAEEVEKPLNSKRNFMELEPKPLSKKSAGRPKKHQNEEPEFFDPEDPCPVEIDTSLQAQIPALGAKDKRKKKRQLKSVWDPENMQRNVVEKYFDQLDSKIETEITNEEAKINLLKDFGFDVKRTLEYVNNDVAFYKRFFRFTRKRVPKNYNSGF